MALASYSPAAYDKIPLLGDAGEHFESMSGKELVDRFSQVFLKHNMSRVFGLSLLHRHFDLAIDERLVEYHGTSVPWKTLDEADAFIQPINWALAEDGTMRPFEFEYSPDTEAHANSESPENPEYSKFIQEFTQLLHQVGATDLFGLCSYPGDDFEGRVEITQARANINLHPKDAPDFKTMREAAWYFSPNLLGKCVCICGGTGSHDSSNPHRGHVTK